MFQNAFSSIKHGVKKPKQLNKMLPYLTPTDINALEILLGSDTKVLAAGEAQLMEADHGKKLWRTVDAGIACFVRDQNTKNHYIRIYNLQMKSQLWEQYVNETLSVVNHVSEDSMLTIEGEGILVGLNFNHIEDAKSFKSAMEKRSKSKKPTEDVEYCSIPNADQASSSSSKSNSSFASTVRSQGQHFMEGAAAAATAAAESIRKVGDMTNKNLVQPTAQAVGSFIEQTSDKLRSHKKKEIEIGEPTDFKQLAHIGWRVDEGFQSRHYVNFEELDPTIQQLLRLIGETPTNFSKEDSDFVYDFVRQSGGIDQLKEELNRESTIGTVQTGGSKKSGIRTPSWSSVSYVGRPKVAPPPPPTPPLPPISSLPSRPISMESLPPPPSAPPPPPPPPSGGISQVKKRITILENISAGKSNLRPTRKPSEAKGSVNRVSTKPQELDGIAGALAKALAERRQRIESDDDSSTEEMRPKEEWED